MNFAPRLSARAIPRGLRAIGQQHQHHGQNIVRRWTSTAAGRGTQVSLGLSWKTGHVVGALAVAISAGYALGVYNSGSASLGLLSHKHEVSPVYGSIKDFERAIVELREVLGEDAVSTDDEDLRLHGYSEWSTVNCDQLPVAVAYPKSTADVSKIAQVCYKFKVPMVPFSGGSSLEGNFSAPFGGMSIDFAHMDKIIKLHPDDLDVVVQPSIQWMELNEQIKHSGLFFPIDPGPSAKIGGMIGTNCSGTNAVRYGTMKDWVINLTVVLADGRVIKTRNRPRKSSAGYNLAGIFVGSEGTLGLVTEATLKLAVIPEETRVGIATFPSIRDAANVAMAVIRSGVQVHTSFEFAKTDQEGHELWSARKQTLWSMLALRKEGSDDIWSTDVAVPLSRLPDIIELSKKDLDELDLFAGIVGHIGDGNFHEGIVYNRNNPEEVSRIEKCVHDMVDRALEMDGSCTGEHGIGLGKKKYLIKELGMDTLNVMRSIKRSLDPLWLLNPGKIFDAVPGEEEMKSKK
ncbi:oxidoreductase [Trichophyton equinum CBS 127.97]|uniref:D-lactate dehydrogenase (cytochrome) n=1 Tax=Trichophyton equinum (strain ATCC MYA-4606 / CBS 127.97) TaxID=559882 RepID=F2PVD7_TRIEC|nr:oxidoreductase [Trichophyton equinum CBS 127.97]